MMQLKFLLLFVAMVCICKSTALAQRNTTPSEQSVNFLRQFRSDYIKSKLEKKPALLQTYYGDNIRLMVEYQRTVFGNANVMMYHTLFSNRFDTKSYTRKELEILDLGTMVVEDGVFTTTIVSKATGKEHELKGKYQNIWEKSANGKLSLITEGGNYDHAVDLGNQLRFDEVPVTDIALSQHVPIKDATTFELAAMSRFQESTITEHDSKIWSQFYADDAILFAQRHSRLEGRKAIDEYIESHAKEMPVFEKLAIRNDRIDDLGEFVIEYASHVAVWRNGESSGVGVGKDLRLWKRQKNGSLKIFRHIGMYD